MDFGEDLTGFIWKKQRLEDIVLNKATLLPVEWPFFSPERPPAAEALAEAQVEGSIRHS
jgi:hypothetical protein